MSARTVLDAIQQRADNATEGPWVIQRSTRHTDVNILHPLAEEGRDQFVAGTGDPHYDGTVEDAEFIAAARTDIPRLVAALRAVLDLAEWHETKADKARLYPGPGNEAARVMTKAATVHDDAARRLRAAITDHLTNGEPR